MSFLLIFVAAWGLLRRFNRWTDAHIRSMVAVAEAAPLPKPQPVHDDYGYRPDPGEVSARVEDWANLRDYDGLAELDVALWEYEVSSDA